MKYVAFFSIIFSAQYLIAQQPKEELSKMYHQFDFWLGSWDVYKFGTDSLVGESHIESIIDSMGLLENYAVPKGLYAGKSLNKYNPARERWEQYWIDNSGLTLLLYGGIMDNKMVMSDLENGDSKNGLNKIEWDQLENKEVRQTWSISVDEGKTWSVVFDGVYKRRINN